MMYTGLQSKGTTGINVYTLKGEAPFDNFYRFLWYLENDRKLYKIQNIRCRDWRSPPTDKKDGAGARDLRYDRACLLLVRGGALQLAGRPVDHAEPAECRPVHAGHLRAAFRRTCGRWWKSSARPRRRSSPGRHLLRIRTNTIRTLQEGDEIYLGYVTKIDPENGQARVYAEQGRHHRES